MQVKQFRKNKGVILILKTKPPYHTDSEQGIIFPFTDTSLTQLSVSSA